MQPSIPPQPLRIAQASNFQSTCSFLRAIPKLNSAQISAPLGKGTLLKRALTILLPVRNAQSTLADTVGRVLDMAADVSEQFEILIIDDASADATNEVAHDLCRHYPQIRLLRHKKPLGEDAAVRAISAQIRGEVVCVRDAQPLTFETIPLKAPPSRPNFLHRSRTFVREGL
jgi:hypothetical protein